MTLPAHIKAAITRFDAAAQDYGAMYDGPQPDNHYAITHQYETTRAALERAIEKAIGK